MSRASRNCAASSVKREDGPRVSHRQRAGGHVLANFVRQSKQTHVIRDRRAVLANRVGDLLLRELEVVGKPAIGLRFFNRIQILTLNVLDQRGGEQAIVRNVAYDDRHLEQSRALRRAPAALAGDDLVAVVGLAHDDGLNDAVGSDRSREIVDLRVVDAHARLEFVGTQEIRIDLERAFRRWRRGSW